jgi:tetratricopeptide (TPR) repeat protein
VGDVLAVQGDLAGALAAYRESLDTRRALVARDPSNTQWRRDVTVSLNRVGDVLAAQGDHAGALAAYRESLEITRALITRDPRNTQWQRDVSVSLNRVGEVLVAQGDLTGALAAYRESLEITRALVTMDPSNTQWQRDVSVSLDRVGEVLVAQGDLAGALAAYRESLVLRRALAARDPSNAQWQSDLQFGINNIGGLAYNFVIARDFDRAIEVADEAISLARNTVRLYTNRAHALMFLGRVEEARSLYLRYRGEQNVRNGKSWENIVREDFAELRKAGLVHALMDEIESRYTAGG